MAVNHNKKGLDSCERCALLNLDFFIFEVKKYSDYTMQ